MQIIPYLIDQATFETQIEARMRDTSNARWSDVEIYGAINDAIQMWSTRVLMPYYYTISGGWIAGTYEYSLPSYITSPMQPQMKIYVGVYDYPITISDTLTTTWVDIPAWGVESDGSGGQKLRLEVAPRSLEGRVIWWGHQQTIPTTITTLLSTITSSQTSLTLVNVANIPDSGYLKLDSEWIGYSKVDRTSGTTTLNNLVHSLTGTLAASHTGGVSAYFGIAAPRQDLYQQLQYQVMANLNALYLTDASPQEKDHHTFQMRYYQQLADEFGCTTPRNTALKWC